MMYVKCQTQLLAQGCWIKGDGPEYPNIRASKHKPHKICGIKPLWLWAEDLGQFLCLLSCQFFFSLSRSGILWNEVGVGFKGRSAQADTA